MSRNDLRRVRAFIAVPLAGSVVKRAAELAKKLKASSADVKWVETKEMHLTLKFLGDIHRDEILKLCRILREVSEGFEPFDLVFGGLGAFPNTAQPRTLWLGIQEGREELVALQKKLDQALHAGLGFTKEMRQFTPHLTIGRVQHGDASLMNLLEQHREFPADSSSVEEMTLYSSLLTKLGPIYEPLGHGVLGEPADRPLVDDDEDEEIDTPEEEFEEETSWDDLEDEDEDEELDDDELDGK